MAASLIAIVPTLLAQPSGQWDFNTPTDGLNATVGGDLGYLDGPGNTTSQGTQFGSTTALGIPDIGGVAAQVMKFPTNTAGMGYSMPTPAAANAGGGYVNEYSLIMDVLFPAASMNKLRALLDADVGLVVNPDSEFFVAAQNGIGTKGQSYGRLGTNTWHRIGIVTDFPEGGDRGDIRFYVDGTEVGVRQGVAQIDDRFALSPGATANLFADDTDETSLGYVNSIQLWGRALTKGEMRALGGPTAAGLPQTIPPVPSGIEKWIPSGEFASRTTPVGAVIIAGSTTIQDSSISVKLNGVTQTLSPITRNGEFITVTTGPQNLIPGNSYTNEITYTDSLAGPKTFTRVFTAAIFYEDFEGLTLGPGLEEAHAADIGWTNNPPPGWSIIRTNMAGWDSPDDDGDGRPDGDGRSEWFGWAFANKDWWVRADDQERSNFTLGTGTLAIADNDEWDDGPHSIGFFNSELVTPPISLAGVAANSAFLRFASSWRDEALDDPNAARFPVGPNGEAINNQTVIITAYYDGAAPVQLLKWDSDPASPTFHDDNTSESVLVPLNNPAGAQNMVLRFAMTNAANDWWWAIDNIVVNAGASAPTVTKHPIGGLFSPGGEASLTVEASGTEPFNYQWKHAGTNIPGATSKTLTLRSLSSAEAGSYTVEVRNVAGPAQSLGALIELYSGPLTNGLVAHLKFDGNLNDSSGKANNGQAVGAPTFETGKVGNAVHIPSGTDYVSLGAPADLNFGTSTDFSIAFWARVNAFNGDPSLIGNKDWDSGSNPGYVIFTDSNRKIDWNLAGAPGTRKDGDAVVGIYTNNVWRHVVLTFDRDGGASIYVDGVRSTYNLLTADQNNLDTPDGFATNIGQDGAGNYGSVFSDLTFDDLGIWRRVLSVQEAKAIYDAAVGGKDLSQAKFEPPTTKITGQWDFNNGDLSATVGAPLAYRGDTQGTTTFPTMDINGQPAKVMGFPATTPAQGYIMPHGAAPNGGGQFVNQYTLILDLMFPAESNAKWRALLQTNAGNSNDGDFFVNESNGIGISGSYHGSILANTWHRVAFVFNNVNTNLTKYIDGVRVGQQNVGGLDGRFTLDTTALLFADEDNETAAGFVNSIQFRDGLMTDAEIAALGGATAAGIPSGTGTTGPTITASRSGGVLTITVTGSGTFQLQKKNALTDATWTNVGAPSPGPFSNIATDGTAGFFRVQQQ